MGKTKLKNLHKICAVCGRKIEVVLYQDCTYRGGHCFGKILAGNKDTEYWECPKCYW